ncbi:MAG: alpha/beta hydrolase [Ferruginibacter sp.]|nr:alpha/beta hydrolase [Ferruginibacter sp.]
MYIIFIICVVAWLIFCAGCMRFRLSDQKAYSLFKSKNVPLKIYDTIIDNRHLHFAISGNSGLPTLVFIHGSPGSWSNYTTYMLDADLQKKFRVMSIDRPGFGYSDFGNPMHLHEQSELLIRAIAAHQNDKPVYLAGHSIGGPVVAQMAAMSPGSFKKIVIMSGSISPYLEKKERWRYIMDNTVLRKFLPGAFAPSNTEITWFKKDLYELEKDFPLVNAEVIFIHGDKDNWVPIGNVQYGMEKMTHAASIQTDTLKGEGHLVPWKRFEDIKVILLNLY